MQATVTSKLIISLQAADADGCMIMIMLQDCHQIKAFFTIILSYYQQLHKVTQDTSNSSNLLNLNFY